MSEAIRQYRLAVIWRKIRLFIDKRARLDSRKGIIFYSFRYKNTGLVSKKVLQEGEIMRIFFDLYPEVV